MESLDSTEPFFTHFWPDGNPSLNACQCTYSKMKYTLSVLNNDKKFRSYKSKENIHMKEER